MKIDATRCGFPECGGQSWASFELLPVCYKHCGVEYDSDRRRLNREISEHIRTYIVAHPNASPQEVLAEIGVPFVRGIYEAVLDNDPAMARHLRESPNPHDRAWWEKPS